VSAGASLPPDDGTPHFDYGEEPAAHGRVLVRGGAPPATGPSTHRNGRRWNAERRADDDDHPASYEGAEAKPSLGLRLAEYFAAEQAADRAAEGGEQDRAVSVLDFYSYLPMRCFLFVPTRELWPGESVIARCEQPTEADGSVSTKKVPRKGKGGKVTFEEVPMPATEWLDECRPVDQMTWAPGERMVIADKLVAGGGWIDRPGCNCFNLYRPPQIEPGNVGAAGPWLQHLRRVFPEDADHIIKWLAHRVQRPGQKVNHALVLMGAQGVGKDTILEPVKHAVGPWNFNEVTPTAMLGRFNGFVKSVILRVNEARDLGELDRFSFYDHMKMYTAAPPDVIRCDEKNLREHAVMNVCGVIITSNYKDGIYLPADDRRHYVAWSSLTKEDFTPDYWRTLWSWYYASGMRHVAAYLAAADLSGFDAKAPPPKTRAFSDVVDSNRAPEDAELADALEGLHNPPALTLTRILEHVLDEDFRQWLKDRRNRRQIPHRMEVAGYVPTRNPSATDGLWKIQGRRQAVYARKALSPREQLAAAAALSSAHGQ
jgi:hypothetical protein